jgi:hypothetical protein
MYNDWIPNNLDLSKGMIYYSILRNAYSAIIIVQESDELPKIDIFNVHS